MGTIILLLLFIGFLIVVDRNITKHREEREKKEQQEREKKEQQEREEKYVITEQRSVIEYSEPKNTHTYTVYVIKRKGKRKMYIGMTNDFERRKSEHFSLEYQLKNKKYLYDCMNLNDDFEMIPLRTGLSYSSAAYLEATLIKRLQTLQPYGYNVKEEFENRTRGLNTYKYDFDTYYFAKSITKEEIVKMKEDK